MGDTDSGTNLTRALKKTHSRRGYKDEGHEFSFRSSMQNRDQNKVNWDPLGEHPNEVSNGIGSLKGKNAKDSVS